MIKNHKGRKYTIAPYQAHWPKQFAAEAKVVRGILGEKVLQVEHVGSTAVPGMAGKPLVDMFVVVKNIKEVESYIPAMQKAGYTSYGDFLKKNSYLFTREINGDKLVNMHIFSEGHVHIAEMLELRDYLRNHPEEVKEYSKLKHALYKKYAGDYGSYRMEKDDYMEQLKRRAAEAGK